jgi:transcriptional regulator with XRE-family HTH domain
MELAHRVFITRQDRRLSQKGLARIAGMSRQTVGDIEAGREAMMATWKKIAVALEVDLDVLVGARKYIIPPRRNGTH